MNESLHRIAVALACVLGLMGTSCSADSDGSSAWPPQDSPGTLDQTAARAAWQAAIAEPEPDLLANLPQGELEPAPEVEKIRKGSAINGSHILGNAVVLIFNEALQSCTAQVINRWFLLTAAHCTADMFPSDSGTVFVAYTNSQGGLDGIHAGEAAVVAAPNWSPGNRDKDLALIFLFDGPMQTCHGTLSQCSPDIPQNAMCSADFRTASSWRLPRKSIEDRERRIPPDS
jgi:hypothetical protein